MWAVGLPGGDVVAWWDVVRVRNPARLRGFSVVQSEESSWRSGCGWFGGGSEPWVAILKFGVRWRSGAVAQ